MHGGLHFESGIGWRSRHTAKAGAERKGGLMLRDNQENTRIDRLITGIL